MIIVDGLESIFGTTLSKGDWPGRVIFIKIFLVFGSWKFESCDSVFECLEKVAQLGSQSWWQNQRGWFETTRPGCESKVAWAWTDVFAALWPYKWTSEPPETKVSGVLTAELLTIRPVTVKQRLLTAPFCICFGAVFITFGAIKPKRGRAWKQDGWTRSFFIFEELYLSYLELKKQQIYD